MDINFKKFFKKISQNSDFREFLKNEFSEIKTDIFSVAINPQCSCRKTIKNFINDNKDDFIEVIKRWNRTYNDNFEVFEDETEKVTNESKLFFTHDFSYDNEGSIGENPTLEDDINPKDSNDEIEPERVKNTSNGRINSNTYIEIDDKSEGVLPRNFRGEVLIIPPDPEKYKELINHLDTHNIRFQNVSPMETEMTDSETGEVQTVWVLFFT